MSLARSKTHMTAENLELAVWPSGARPASEPGRDGLGVAWSGFERTSGFRTSFIGFYKRSSHFSQGLAPGLNSLKKRRGAL